MTTIKRLLANLSYLLWTMVFVCSCTYTYDVPDVLLKEEFAVRKKFDLKVNLRLPEDMKEAKWQHHIVAGDTYVIPIGPQLVKNSRELAEMLFRETRVANSSDPIDSNHSYDAILTTRVAALERSVAPVFGDSIFTLVLEWKLEDASNKLIWIDSIKGEVESNDREPEEQTELLLRDLFGKSLKAIQMSPEINLFYEKKRQGTAWNNDSVNSSAIQETAK